MIVNSISVRGNKPYDRNKSRYKAFFLTLQETNQTL